MHHKCMMHSCQLLHTNVPNSYCYSPIQSCETRNGQRFEDTSEQTPRYRSDAGHRDLLQEVFLNTVCRHHPEEDNDDCSVCHEYQTYDASQPDRPITKRVSPPELPPLPIHPRQRTFFGKVSTARGVLQNYTRTFLCQYFYKIKRPQAMNNNNPDRVEDFGRASSSEMVTPGYECYAGGEYSRPGDDDGGGIAELFRKIWHGFIVMGTRRELCEVANE